MQRLRKTTFTAREPPDATGNDVRQPMPVVAMPPTDATFSIGEPRDDIGHRVGKPTPPKDAISGTDEPRDAIGHDVGKPTPSFTTPVIATPPKDALYSIHELPDAIGNDARKSTLPKDAIFSIGHHDAQRREVNNG
jgi:hypothetical protein